MNKEDQIELAQWAQSFESRLAQLSRKVESASLSPADLRFASVDAEGGINFKDEYGNVIYKLRRGDSGMVEPEYFGGPDPERPEAPFVDYGGEVVKIQHSGLDENEEQGPADHLRTLIHLSQEAEFEAGPNTYAGSFSEIDGTMTHRLPGGAWFIAVQWETRSHKLSQLSEAVEVEVPPLVDEQDIQDALDEAQARLDAARDEFEQMNQERIDAIQDINDVVLPALEQSLTDAMTELEERVGDVDLSHLESALAELNETRLPALEATLADKAESSELPVLEDRLTSAFGEGLDAAVTAASEDATAKANAAQEAAEAEAGRLAKAEAQAAQSAAEQAAAQDALDKANAARDAAIESASDDAQEKADAAKEAAETAAAADAKAKADAAQAEAIRQAALDATAKANAAKDAAEATAKDYADQQDVILKGEAAADAQTKADAVREIAESKASPEWVLSRGTDLVTNGTGYLNDNTNFTDFEFGPSDAPTGARGSFVVESNRRPAGTFTDELLPVDPTRSYMLSVMAREQNEGVASRFYVGLAPYDSEGHQIKPQMYSHDPLTYTELTEPLNPGDTTITVASTENFGRLSASGYVGIWDWVDGNGRTWPVGEYTRDYPRFDDIDGNTLILRSPYTGAPRPVGTPVSNNRAGGTYMYAVSNKLATDTWERTHRIFGGIHDTTSGNAVTAFPPATAAVRIMWLPNYGGAENSRQAFAAVSFSDASAALAEAEAAQADAEAAQARADEAHANAGTAWTHADAAMTRAGEAETNAIEEAGRLATAAREAAEAEADRLATAEAQAAQSAAEANAAADALAKANAARDAAIDSASDDATAKADAAKTAAETAAAADAKAKADAAQAEAIRQAKLDATAKADAAQAAAEQAAKDHADDLPKVMHGTGAPSGTAPDGSVWWQHQGSLQGAVTAQWNRVDGSWVSTPIDSEAIANLDVGKLTAGGAVIADAIIDDLSANQGMFDRLDAREAWIGDVALEDGAVKARSVDATEVFSDTAVINEVFANAVRAKLLEADEALIGGTLLKDEAVTARTIAAEAVKAANIDVQSLVADEAFANTVWADVVRAGLLTAEEALIGGALIKEGAIDVAKINVTEELTAAIAQFLTVKAGMIEANAIDADKIASGAIEAGHLNGRIIKGEHIQGDTFAGQTFDGGTFTGSTFQTDSLPNHGLKFSADGIHGWGDNGEKTLQITGEVSKDMKDPDAGNFLTGRFYTNGKDLPGIILNPDYGPESHQGPGVWFSESGWVDASQPAIWVNKSDFYNLTIRGKRWDNGSRSHVEVQGGINVTEGGIIVDNGTVQGDLGAFNQLEASGDSNFWNHAYFRDWIRNTGYWEVSGSSANVYMNSNWGTIGRISSRRAIKLNIDDSRSNPHDILKLHPRSWIDMGEVSMEMEEQGLDLDELVEPDKGYGPSVDEEVLEEAIGYLPHRTMGLVAEEVAGAGLHEFVEWRDVDGSGVETPASVAYDRMWTLLIPIAREQRDKLQSQEERISDLEKQNEDLEARLARLEGMLDAAA